MNKNNEFCQEILFLHNVLLYLDSDGLSRAVRCLFAILHCMGKIVIRQGLCAMECLVQGMIILYEIRVYPFCSYHVNTPMR